MLVHLLIIGVVLGGVYLFFATGFTLLYGTFDVMNLAQGTVMTLGAFVAVFLDNKFSTPIVVSFLAAVGAGGIASVVLDVLVLMPIAHRTAAYRAGPAELTPIVATLAFSGVIIGLLTNQVQGASYTFRHAGWLTQPVSGSLSRLGLVIVCGAVVFLAVLYFVLNRTRAGARIRSVAEDRSMAAALGIRPNLVSSATFFAAGAMAGATGALVGILYSNVNVTIGDSLLLIAIVIITVGGLGSLPGTVIIAVLVGLLQTFCQYYLNNATGNLVIYGLLFIVLIVRPAGLLGKNTLAEGVGRR